MFNDLEFDPAPPAVPEATGNPSWILIRLLEEVERNKQEEQRARASLAPRNKPHPRPFAYD